MRLHHSSSVRRSNKRPPSPVTSFDFKSMTSIGLTVGSLTGFSLLLSSSSCRSSQVLPLLNLISILLTGSQIFSTMSVQVSVSSMTQLGTEMSLHLSTSTGTKVEISKLQLLKIKKTLESQHYCNPSQFCIESYHWKCCQT